MYIYIYHIYIYIHIHTYGYKYIHVYEYRYIHMYAFIFIFKGPSALAGNHCGTFIHIHIHVYEYYYIHVHSHFRRGVCLSRQSLGDRRREGTLGIVETHKRRVRAASRAGCCVHRYRDAGIYENTFYENIFF